MRDGLLCLRNQFVDRASLAPRLSSVRSPLDDYAYVLFAIGVLTSENDITSKLIGPMSYFCPHCFLCPCEQAHKVPMEVSFFDFAEILAPLLPWD